MKRTLSRALMLSAALGAATALGSPRVVIDPGHGGTQDGAAGPAGLMEKHLALSIAQKLKAELERRYGAKVLLTRERDVQVALVDRVMLANRHQPDLFISVHANSMPTRKARERTEGIETFFLSANASEDVMTTVDRENAEAPVRLTPSRTTNTLAFILADLQRSEAHAESSRLAYLVHQRMIGETKANNRGVHQAPFSVLTGIDAPAVLVEVGYISHPREGRRLREEAYQRQLAAAIAEGAGAFLRELEKREAQAARR
ncbi:MAG: N-acetylmuramoyl-L-alanine amidase family protein [Myxococcaceae bacterium]